MPKQTVIFLPGPTGAAGADGADGAVSTAVTSTATLAAVVTTTITPGGTGSIALFVDGTTQALQTWQLRSSTAATVAGSIQRPDDYATTTNEKVWYRC